MNIHTLFYCLDDDDIQRLSDLCKQWEKEKIKAEDISLTVHEYDLLFGQGKVVLATKSVRERLNCTLKTAHEAVKREKKRREFYISQGDNNAD